MGSIIGRLGRSSVKTTQKVNIKRPPLPEHHKDSFNGDGAVHQQNTVLLDRLKEVYVSTSSDVVQQENPYAQERPGRKLPQETAGFYGDAYNVGTVATEGYLTVQQVTEIFDRRKANEEVWSAAKVASSYKLTLEDAECLLKHFNTFKVVVTSKDDLRPEMKFHNFHE